MPHLPKRNNTLITFIQKPMGFVEQLFFVSLVISPLFLLTVLGWMTHILPVCMLLGIFVLAKNRFKSPERIFSDGTRLYIKILSVTLTLPLSAVFIAQSFRGQYTWPYYDSPFHIFVCIFVFLGILKTGPRVVEYMSYVFPLGVLLALINILAHPNLQWGAERLSTQALDPLAFGSLSLTLGLLSLVSIKLHPSHSNLLTALKLTGFFAGAYLSVLSGSRTGWLALPIVGLLWLYFNHKKFSLLSKTGTALSVLMLVMLSYQFSATVHQRVNEAVQEVVQYQWNPPKNAPNPDTSVGDRISFVRIAIFLLQQRPLSGWGDGNFASVIDDPVLSFAASASKKTALEAGFHNEITANMVRSGIWGLVSSIALFLVPTLFFWRSMRSTHRDERNVAFLALTFMTCQFVSSLSMELLNLRYAASFYGLMLAIFIGQILFYQSNNTVIADHHPT